MQPLPPCEGSYSARHHDLRTHPAGATSRLGFWRIEADGGTLRLDPTACQILGLKSVEGAGLADLLERAAPDERGRVAEWFAVLGHGGADVGRAWQWRMEDEDGRPGWVEMQVVTASGGRLGGEVVGSLRDMSMERRMEVFLAAQDTLLQAALGDCRLGEVLGPLAGMLDPCFGAGHGVMVWEVVGGGMELELVVGQWAGGGEPLGRVGMGAAGGVIGAAACSGEAVYCGDLQVERRSAWGRRARGEGWQGVWAVPLRAGGGRVAGVLALMLRRGRLPDEGERRMIERLGLVVGMVLERGWQRVEALERSQGESEERFRAFAEHADEILWIVDLEAHRLEYLSPAFERVYGLERGALVADLAKWIEFIHPADHDRAAELMPTIQRGERFTWEFRMFKPDGTICWIESIAFPMPGKDGSIRRVGGKSQDITERKRAEEAAQRSVKANAFRLALADALVALSDPDELRTAAAGMLEAHFGASGVKWSESECGGGQWVDGGERVGGKRRGSRLVVEDVEVAGVLSDVEREEMRRRGVGAWVEVSLWKGGQQVARLAVEHGQARPWEEEELVLVEEVAERLWAALEQARAEYKLRDSEQRLRLVSEHIPALIAYVEPDLRYKFTNREYSVWLGKPGEDFGGRHARDVLGEKTFAHRLPLLRRAMAGEMVRVEAMLRHQVLGERTIDLSLVPDFAEGRVRGCYVMAVDVTERLQLVATLREADQRKNEFLATLAHELRNPLAPIRTGVEVLKHSLGHPQRAAQVIDVIERQTTQMVRLVDDLLDIARISRGTLKLRQEVVALGDVFADAVEMVRPQLDRAGHRLEVSLPVEPLYAYADAGRLGQVISNLLNNSVRYTPDGGHIWLSAEEQGDCIAIVVRDNGDGIDPTMQASIFEMFTQLGREGRANGEGLGIGLTLVRLLVGLHGGTVKVFSQGLGKGSTFRVELPRAAAPERHGGGGAGGSAGGEASRPACKVLVVDDARSTADMMALFLKLEGYEAQVAYSGAEALQAIEQSCPRIIFMDIGMPLMDGFETARRIRQLPAARDTVLIALTGWSQPSDRERTRAAGFDHHLVKPVEPKTLRALLDDLGAAG